MPAIYSMLANKRLPNARPLPTPPPSTEAVLADLRAGMEADRQSMRTLTTRLERLEAERHAEIQKVLTEQMREERSQWEAERQALTSERDMLARQLEEKAALIEQVAAEGADESRSAQSLRSQIEELEQAHAQALAEVKRAAEDAIKNERAKRKAQAPAVVMPPPPAPAAPKDVTINIARDATGLIAAMVLRAEGRKPIEIPVHRGPDGRIRNLIIKE